MNSAKRNVLVTGGCGAIGINLITRLLQDDRNDVHVLDNLSSGSNTLPPGVKFSNIDISNREKLNGFFKSNHPNIIFHLAAHFANQNSVDHPVSDTATNVIGVINILECQRENTSLEKFVYASSSCVYGNSAVMSEDDNVSPYDTPYAVNKYVGEMYCKYYAEIQQLPIACARIFNNFGPGELPGAYRNVIPNFILKALKGEDIWITGTGDETRDFTFVDSTVDLLHRLAFSDFAGAEVFNSGTGVGLSIRELAESIIAATESPSKIRYTEARSWDRVKHRRADISKSKKLLGYDPKPNLPQELGSTVQWIRQTLEL